MNKVTSRKQYHWVDIAKLGFAVCIVALHSGMINDYSFGYYIQALLFRLGVPYFFVASGFFLGAKCYNRGDYNGYANWGGVFKRLIIKLLVFTPIAIAVVSVKMFNYLTITEYIVKMVRHIIFYPYGSLWYVNALIVAFLILIPAIKHDKLISYIGIGGFLYVIFLLFNRYNFVIADTPLQPYVKFILGQTISLRNGLFVGLLFVGIGLFIAKNENRIKHNFKRILICTLISSILLCVEVCILRDKIGIDDNSFYLSYPIFIPLLFCTTIMLPFKSKANTITLRNLSTSIYFMQKPLLGICGLLGVFQASAFILTLAIISLICLLIYPHKIQPFYDWIR